MVGWVIEAGEMTEGKLLPENMQGQGKREVSMKVFIRTG